jgi:hypothetical protein
MGEYEPNDSRNVTLKQDRAPGEPPRTGPREGETRTGSSQHEQQLTELEQDERDDAAKRERAIEVDEDELDAARRRSPDGWRLSGAPAS